LVQQALRLWARSRHSRLAQWLRRRASWQPIPLCDSTPTLTRPHTRIPTSEAGGCANLPVRHITVIASGGYEIQNESWSDHHELSEVLNPHLLDQMGFPNRIEVTKRDAVAWQTKIVEAIPDEERTLASGSCVSKCGQLSAEPLSTEVTVSPGEPRSAYHVPALLAALRRRVGHGHAHASGGGKYTVDKRQFYRAS